MMLPETAGSSIRSVTARSPLELELRPLADLVKIVVGQPRSGGLRVLEDSAHGLLLVLQHLFQRNVVLLEFLFQFRQRFRRFRHRPHVLIADPRIGNQVALQHQNRNRRHRRRGFATRSRLASRTCFAAQAAPRPNKMARTASVTVCGRMDLIGVVASTAGTDWQSVLPVSRFLRLALLFTHHELGGDLLAPSDRARAPWPADSRPLGLHPPTR